MASLKNIKLKIQSVKKTSTVTRAMEAVSAVKMRKSQERALGGRAYAAAALSVLERLAGTVEIARHPLMQRRPGKFALIIITSDKGLAGSLNSGVIRKAEEVLKIAKQDRGNVIVYAFGRKGGDYFATRGYKLGILETNIKDNIIESDVRQITAGILNSPEITEVVVVYQNFISTFEQRPTWRSIVPVDSAQIKILVDGIRPAKGKYSPRPESTRVPAPATYTIEPDADSVLTVLLPKLLNIAVFHALLEAKASEHSARMVAMKNATDNAKERAKQYTRTFNKIRQAAITREISEIVGGIEAMK